MAQQRQLLLEHDLEADLDYGRASTVVTVTKPNAGDAADVEEKFEHDGQAEHDSGMSEEGVGCAGEDDSDQDEGWRSEEPTEV